MQSQSGKLNTGWVDLVPFASFLTFLCWVCVIHLCNPHFWICWQYWRCALASFSFKIHVWAYFFFHCSHAYSQYTLFGQMWNMHLYYTLQIQKKMMVSIRNQSSSHIYIRDFWMIRARSEAKKKASSAPERKRQTLTHPKQMIPIWLITFN